MIRLFKWLFKKKKASVLSASILSDSLVDSFCQAPDGQIDKAIVKRMRVLKGSNNKKLVVEELKSMLADCVECSLASSFGLALLEVLISMAESYPDE